MHFFTGLGGGDNDGGGEDSHKNGDDEMMIHPSTMPNDQDATQEDNNNPDENISYATNGISNAPSSVYASLRPTNGNTTLNDEWSNGDDDVLNTPKTIRCVAFSPDGQFLASGGDDRKVRVYSLVANRQVYENMIDGAVLSMSYTITPPTIDTDVRMNQFLWVGGDDEKITVIDTTSFQTVKSMDMNGGDVEIITHSPLGNQVAVGGSSPMITIFDPQTYQVLKKVHVKGPISGLAYSIDGKTLSSGGAMSTMNVFDTTTFKRIKTFDARNENESAGYITSMKYSPDSKFLAVAQTMQRNHQGAKLLTVYNLPSYQVVKEYKRKMEVNSIAFSADSKRLVIADDEKKVVVCDTSTFNIVKEFEVDSEYLSVDLAANNILACGGYDERLRLYDITTFEVVTEFHHGMVVNKGTMNDVRSGTISFAAEPSTTPPDVIHDLSIDPKADQQKSILKTPSIQISRKESNFKDDEVIDILSDVGKSSEPEQDEEEQESTKIVKKKEFDKEQFRKDCMFLLAAAGVLILMIGGLIGIIIALK